jgi:excisionase family DNA binding protein
MAESTHVPKLAFSPEEAATAAGIGRTAIFEAIKNKKLLARKNGRRTLIAADDLAAWIKNLPQASEEAAA